VITIDPPALEPIPDGPFAGLTCHGYKSILADPPWKFATRSDKGRDRSPDQHYDTMELEEIEALPVELLASRDCFLFLWVCNPFPPSVGERIMRAWGFRYSGVAFTWVKSNPRGRGYHRGLGYGTRQNTERCLLGRRGSPVRLSARVDELIFWPRMEHSRKPPVARTRITKFCAGPHVELFARESGSAEWTGWGNEARKFDVLDTRASCTSESP